MSAGFIVPFHLTWRQARFPFSCKSLSCIITARTLALYTLDSLRQFTMASRFRAAMLWGFTTDRVHQRKPIIAYSFVVVGIDFFALFFLRSASGIGLVYSLFGLFASASATPYNLLIMETQPKTSWASAFAKFSMIGTLGNVFGYLLSLVWVEFLPFQWLVIPLSGLCLASAGTCSSFDKGTKFCL